MQEINRYEFAVVRFVPRMEREEFVNIGLAMMCKRKRWLKVDIRLPEGLLRVFAPDFDLTALKKQLQALTDIAAGSDSAGPVARYPVEERFRWISAVKSSVIQTSRPHPGLCTDLDETFERLFNELVC